MAYRRKGLNRRQFLKVSAGAATALVLAPQMRPSWAQETVKLRVGSWDAAEAEPIEAEVMAGFKELFPNYDVSFEFISESYNDRILTGLAGGEAPDVFLWWDFPMLVQRGGLVDLTPYVNGSSPADLSIYYPQVLDYNRVGDGLYGLPKDFTPRAVFYNKKLFDEAGIPYPTNDWTWDEMVQTAVALTKGEGVDKQYGFWTYDGVYPLQGYVWSNGGDFISPDGKQASGYLDSPQTIEALDRYIKLQTELGVAPSTTAEGGTTVTADSLFINGKLAFYDTGRWPQTQFMAVEGLEFGTVLPPKNNDGKRVTVLHEAGWSMSPKSSHKDEAWELLKWLGGPDANKIRAAAGWALPAQPAVAEDLGFLDNELEKTWFEAVDYATVSACFLRNFNWSQADEEINLVIQAAYKGQTSIEDGLKDLAPIVDDILAG
jgi:multiple sugar transport system substrate-binding protein